MTKRVFAVITVCFLLFFSACTQKQQPVVITAPENDDWAAYMPMEPGNTWIYENGDKNGNMPGITITISGKEKLGKGEAYLSDLMFGGQLQRREYLELIPDKGVYSRRRDSYMGGKQNIFAPDTDDAVLKFPLKVGSSWDWEDNSPQKIKGINQFKVAAYEEVTVPAGVYKAFRIDLLQISPAGDKLSTSIWLVKDIGMVRQSTSVVPANPQVPAPPELVFVLKEYVKGKDVPADKKPAAQHGLKPAATETPAVPVASGAPAAITPAAPSGTTTPGVVIH